MKNSLQKYSEIFKEGKVGVIPTDTIYGISASALLPDAVEKVYRVTSRNSKKPFIILIGSLEDLDLLGIVLPDEKKEELLKFWPGKVSVILPSLSDELEYLHRGGKTLAVRFPSRKDLTELLQKTGPLISTSANPDGEKPAKNISEAKKYFGDMIDFYVDEGDLESAESTIIDMTGGEIKIIRKGGWKDS